MTAIYNVGFSRGKCEPQTTNYKSNWNVFTRHLYILFICFPNDNLGIFVVYMRINKYCHVVLSLCVWMGGGGGGGVRESPSVTSYFGLALLRVTRGGWVGVGRCQHLGGGGQLLIIVYRAML